MKRSYFFSALILSAGLLTACGNNTTETIYTHLEEAVQLEAPFGEQQEPLQQAEQKEYELYEEIISLGMEQYEKIVELADQALQSIEERTEFTKIEKESLQASYDEFMLIEEVVDQIDDEEEKNSLTALREAMDARYESYQTLSEYYSDALSQDQELFTKLKQEDLTMEALQQEIDHVNEIYENVEEAKDDFNQATENYNELKKAYYETAGLNVSYE